MLRGRPLQPWVAGAGRGYRSSALWLPGGVVILCPDLDQDAWPCSDPAPPRINRTASRSRKPPCLCPAPSFPEGPCTLTCLFPGEAPQRLRGSKAFLLASGRGLPLPIHFPRFPCLGLLSTYMSPPAQP